MVPANWNGTLLVHVHGYRDSRSDLLTQAYTSGEGHCNFTGPQLLTALAALDGWVASGTPPTGASFPAALGFLPGFAPPPWPFE